MVDDRTLIWVLKPHLAQCVAVPMEAFSKARSLFPGNTAHHVRTTHMTMQTITLGYARMGKRRDV
ncbi:MAG: hypothetical protein VKJ09_11335 [Leptolyngbya sp.]|nr:hypothetical protein [Leptolyngbya sp.]